MGLLRGTQWHFAACLCLLGTACTVRDNATDFPSGVGGQQSANPPENGSSNNNGNSSTGTNSGNGVSTGTGNSTSSSTNSSTGNQTSGATGTSTTTTGNQTSGNTSSTTGIQTSGSTGTTTSSSSGGANGTGTSTPAGNASSVSGGSTSKPTTATGGSSGATFVVPSDAKPTPATSGVNGAFRVNSSGKLTHNGTAFQVRGGNWFGLEGQDDIARPGAMELYIGAVSWASASDKRTIQQTMTEIQSAPLSLNTIRFPVAPQTLVKGHPDGDYSRTDVKIRNNDPTIYAYADSYEAFTDFLIQANKNNLYVILDMHSCSNHIGWRAGKVDDGPPWTDANRENYKYKKEDYYCNKGEDAYDVNKWIADIHTLAKLPKQLGIKNIIGIDCFNEPFKYSWSQWADLAKMCYDAIAAEDDDLIAIVEGVSTTHESSTTANVYDPEPYGDVDVNPNWGENLYGQQFDPIQIPKDRLCFSPHTYGPAVYVQKQFVDQTVPACVGLEDDAAGKAKCKLVVERSNATTVANLKRGWDQHFGYLVDQKYCVIIGEFGGYKNWPANPVKPSAATIWAHLPTNVRYDWEWQNIFVDYMKAKGLTDFLYWSINPESGDTGGIYNHAYSLSNESGWGVWQGLDTEKASMLGGLK